MNIKHTSTILIVLGLFLVAYGIYATHTAKASLKSASQQVSITTAIQDIRLGMRTLGKNPCGRIKEIYDEPDSSWYQINLQMVKQNSGILNIELLRPRNWLDLQDIKSGNTIYLDLPEMGAVGDALVSSIQPSPPIQQGQGNVVTGRFIHQAANCIDLYIEGQDNPIGCTDNHPFWSEDRQDFIPAGQLNQGERVLLFSGETAQIAQKLPRPGPETVYNLEIWGEHVYCVGKDGLLVHNSCGTANLSGLNYKHSYKYSYRILERATQDPHFHNFPFSFDDVILSEIPVIKSDGYILYRKIGFVNGKKGFFEIGIDNNVITHRFFRPLE